MVRKFFKRYQIEQGLQVVGLRKRNPRLAKPGLEVLLHRLLAMKARRIQHPVFAPPHDLRGDQEIALGLFDPLSRNFSEGNRR